MTVNTLSDFSSLYTVHRCCMMKEPTKRDQMF